MREEHRLKVFGNGVLRKVFRLKRKEGTYVLIKLYNERIRCWHCSPHIMWMMKYSLMRWVLHVAGMAEKTVAYRMLMCGREGRRQLRRPRSRWEDDTTVDLK